MSINFNKNWHLIIVIAAIALVSSLIIILIDSKTSKDSVKEYKTFNVEAEKLEREYIPVRLSVFVNLLNAYKDHYGIELRDMSEPVYDSKDSLVTINVSNKRSARKILTGTEIVNYDWYPLNSSVMSFKAERIDNDVIIYCPALLLVRLVDNVEP